MAIRNCVYVLLALIMLCIFFPFSRSYARVDTQSVADESTSIVTDSMQEQTLDQLDTEPSQEVQLMVPISDDPVDDPELFSPEPTDYAYVEEPNAVMYEPPVLPVTYEDMLNLDLTTSSTMPAEFWKYWLPTVYKPIANQLPLFDQEGINAAWVAAIMIAECGWDGNVVGSFNYFNFTVDTLSYTNFSSPAEAMQYARAWFQQSFFNRAWHTTRPAGYCQWHEGEPLTIERVNEHYAINPDGSVNWNWTKVASEIMVQIYSDYSAWKNG